MIESREESKHIGELVESTLDYLSHQTQAESRHVSVTQLRDLVLSFEHNLKKRCAVWKKVQAIVELNSNVRTLVLDVNGEPSRVWEWVGAHSPRPKTFFPEMDWEEAEALQSPVRSSRHKGKPRQ